ncbi:MAG TPA: cell division protein FtsA [Dehalococcoidia bacterium]|nr:cell division protein FtsA [Dehalococcoidia bacterium]
MEYNIVTVIDIGTTKIATLVAQYSKSGSIEILGHSVVPCKGLSKGNVVDVAKTSEGISQSISILKQYYNLNIKSAFLGITGSHVNFEDRWDKLNSIGKSGVITREDIIKNPLNQIDKNIANKSILHTIPIGYSVDGSDEILNPIGMHSTNLSVKTHIISASPSAVTKLIQAANQSNIQSDGLILEPLASSHSVINESEKNDGVLMIDIGGGTTDLMFFKNKTVKYTAVIPVGGFHFTNDIASTYRIDSREAEYIKIKYGSATTNIKNNFVQEIEMKSKLSPEPIKVSHTELIRLTRERAEELVKLINIKIKPIDFENNPKYKIVITGGTSNLNGLSDLIARNITSNVRIGKPKIGLNNLVKFKNIPEELKNPRFSTVLGMALWAIGGILNETSDSSFEPEKIQKNDPYTYSLNTQLGFLINILKDIYNNVKKISQQIIKNIIKGD